MILPELISESNFLTKMADGTFKQLNPFTGTEVWTVPGRANRPLDSGIRRVGNPIRPKEVEDYCVFCEANLYETPPEKARLVKTSQGYELLRDVRAEALFESRPIFRRIPNLFEIISYDYWAKNYAFRPGQPAYAHKTRYLSTPEGVRHVLHNVDRKLLLSGQTDPATIPDEDKLAMADEFFAGGHELILGPRHFIEEAENDAQLASSGSMTPELHDQYFKFTVAALRDIYLANRYVRYVAVFQNWRQPAGASLDHLHKQLVAIDGRSAAIEREIALIRHNPNVYNDWAVNFAGYRNLIFAENDYAIAFAAFGHRFPTLAIYSKSARSQPWNHSPEELRGMSDIVHACHAAMGSEIPCNEEWYYKPPDADVAMPWRVLIKWRISNPAGFEGGTKIYVNTIDPVSLRDKVVPRLFQLKNEGRIAPMRIAFECECVPNCLKYNPAVREDGDAASLYPPLSGRARETG
jgi:galactose-1-phosphate uridylyltransferase